MPSLGGKVPASGYETVHLSASNGTAGACTEKLLPSRFYLAVCSLENYPAVHCRPVHVYIDDISNVIFCYEWRPGGECCPPDCVHEGNRIEQNQRAGKVGEVFSS